MEPTNWCDLPVEMRAECVKRMDFESKMKMRRTARLEKALVESIPKHVFSEVILRQTEDGLVIEAHESDATLFTLSPNMKQKFDKLIAEGKTKNRSELENSLLFAIFKYGTVRHLMVDNFMNDAMELIEDLREIGPLHVPIFRVYKMNDSNLHTFLESLEGPLKLLDLSFCHPRVVQRVFRDPLILPMLLNTVDLQFEFPSCPTPEFIPELWISQDSPIGSKFRVDFGGPRDDNLVEAAEISFSLELVEKMQDRVVSLEPREVRFRTDNDKKHILYKVFDCSKEDHDECFTALCQVISADMKTSDFETESGWMDYDDL